jgi:hypothetical protein
MVTVAWLSVTGLSGTRCGGASEVTAGAGATTAGGAATLGGATTAGAGATALGGAETLGGATRAGAGAATLGGAAVVGGTTAWALPPTACDVVVVVVTVRVVVVVVVVDVGGVVVPLDGGCSGTGELDVGELVVADVVSDDEVPVSDDGGVKLLSDDVVVEVSDPGATTTGTGIGGGGSPGGSVALASLASTLTVNSCH